jgi:glucose-6-phosphate 1-epimerase
MNNLETLNSRYAIADQLHFKKAGESLAVAEISNALSSATICLQGAHVMAWQPVGTNAPVIWLSQLAKPTLDKSLRGGVPVCWPWFGAHPTGTGFPAHGYARTRPWVVTGTHTLADGSTEINMVLTHNETTRVTWPHPCKVEMLITVGKTLKMALTTTNFDDVDFVIGEALHTYFHVGDIAEARVLGLDGCEYMDKAGGGMRRQQQGAIVFTDETDRVYVNTETTCVIEDPCFQRRIRIAKSGSRSTVVWTPWREKADKMGDFGADGWREMVCVESANALENVVTVKADGKHTLAVEYAVEPACPA